MTRISVPVWKSLLLWRNPWSEATLDRGHPLFPYQDLILKPSKFGWRCWRHDTSTKRDIKSSPWLNCHECAECNFISVNSAETRFSEILKQVYLLTVPSSAVLDIWSLNGENFSPKCPSLMQCTLLRTQPWIDALLNLPHSRTGGASLEMLTQIIKFSLWLSSIVQGKYNYCHHAKLSLLSSSALFIYITSLMELFVCCRVGFSALAERAFPLYMSVAVGTL